MTHVDTSDDELFIFWDHYLRERSSHAFLKQIWLEFPPPKCLFLSRLLCLRYLEDPSSDKRHILDVLEELRTTSGPKSNAQFAVFLKLESDSEIQRNKDRWFQLQLAVAREDSMFYFRNDDYSTLIEVVPLLWQGTRYFRELDKSQEKEFDEYAKEFMEALSNREYIQQLINKYPPSKFKKALETLISLERESVGDSFLSRSLRDVEEGRYKPSIAYNVIPQRLDGAQGGSPSLKSNPRQVVSGIHPCSNGLSLKVVNGSKGDQPKECPPMGRSSPSRSVLPDLTKATAEEIQFAYPGSPTVLDEPEGREEATRSKTCRRLEQSPPYGSGVEGLSRVPAPPWRDKSSQSVSVDGWTRTTRSGERDKEIDASYPKKRRKSLSHSVEEDDQQAFGSLQDHGVGTNDTPIALADLRNSSSHLKNMGVDPLPEALDCADQAVKNIHQPGHARSQVEDMDIVRRDGIHAGTSHVEAEVCPEFGMPSGDAGAPTVVQLERESVQFQRESPAHQTKENEHYLQPRVILGQPTTSAPNISLNRKPSARQDHWDSEGEVDINEEPLPRYRASTRRRYSPLNEERESRPQANTARNRLLIRRKNKAWSLQEIKCLEDGVTMFDRKWRRIKEHFSDVFYDRSHVDLKDKYRNLQKFSKA